MSSLIEKLNTTLGSGEKDCLVRAWNLLKDISDDLYAEDLEDTDEFYHSSQSFKELGRFLAISGIEYEEVETGTNMECGVTVCCGYDFGVDAFGRKKPNFCPMCGKKIVKVN